MALRNDRSSELRLLPRLETLPKRWPQDDVVVMKRRQLRSIGVIKDEDEDEVVVDVIEAVDVGRERLGM